jgi:hypothetical protein
MQVERSRKREWRTGAQRVGTCPEVRNNTGKLVLIPYDAERPKIYRLGRGPRKIR